MNTLNILDKINKYSLFLAILLTPLFFLPFTQNVLDLPKRFLLLVLVVIGLTTWLVEQKLKGELKVKKVGKLFYWAVASVLILFVASTLFSSWMGLSFWGNPYSIANSLLSFLVLLSLSFLVIHNLKEKEYVNLLYWLVGSSALVSLFAVLQLYGASLGIGVATLVGSYNTIAIFAAVIIPLALGLLFHTKEKKLLLAVSSLILLLSVILINFKAAWLVLMIGTLVSLFFSTWNSKQMRIGWVGSLIVCLALALFFFLFAFSLPGFPARPAEVSLSLNSEYDIVQGSLNEGIKNKLLGAGPGTFVFEYSQHHSKLVNDTPFWSTRFRQGNSAFWDWVIEKGVLGAMSLIFLWGVVLRKGFKGVVQVNDKKWEVKLGLLSSFLALVGASFLYPFNFSLWFLFWLTLAFLVGLSCSGVRRINLEAKAVNIIHSLFLVLVITLGVGLIFLQGVRYYADSQYKQGLRYSRNGEIKKAISHISKAAQLTSTTLNVPVDLYYRDLGQLYLRQATKVASDKDTINRGLIQTSVSNGINTLNRATEIAPFNPANWNVKGFFYRNLIGLKQAGDLALKSYQKAAQLEPNSPFTYTEMGRVNILMAQQESKDKKQAYQDASEALSKALKRKPNYAPAHYLKAVVYDQQGNLQQAIDNLKKARLSVGQELGLTFQLGLLYWRDDQLDNARIEFQRVVDVNSNYANARYMLGLIYDEQGEKEKAKEEFEKVAELNPDNERVKQVLSNIKQGKPALEGIGTATTTAPLENSPQEIKE